jgi:REP element-mobilizing transposase RayT
MKCEVYESQKEFAGKKKPSMLRRCVGHDYTERMMYMVTMVVEGRRPLFGTVVGRSDAPLESAEAPRMELSELGQRVAEEWMDIPNYYPQVEIRALQMMPDHLHGIIFIKEKMEKDLSRIIRGFKTGCNRSYRELVLGVSSVATQSQQTGREAQQTGREAQQTGREAQQTGRETQKEDRTHGFLFARGFNDKLLLREGQLQRWLDYLNDNPRRLLMKREQPDLFRVQRNIMKAGQQFSAIGNRFLLERPIRLQVQCSRSLTDEQIAEKQKEWLEQARSGAVLVSPCISKGEKQVMRAAFEEGLPIIVLLENGFTDLAKPGGKRMEACARGQLLLLAPWEHHNERLTIRRDQCLALNELSRMICL